MNFVRFAFIVLVIVACWLFLGISALDYAETNWHICGIPDASDPTALCDFREAIAIVFLVSLLVALCGAVYWFNNRSR